MTLTTEDLGDLPDVDTAAMDAVLEDEQFGKFAILSASEDAFIQAGEDWQPTAECSAFMDATGSEPWVLEYHENGRQFRAGGPVTLDRVREAFGSYLAGASEWRTAFVWGEIEV